MCNVYIHNIILQYNVPIGTLLLYTYVFTKQAVKVNTFGDFFVLLLFSGNDQIDHTTYVFPLLGQTRNIFCINTCCKGYTVFVTHILKMHILFACHTQSVLISCSTIMNNDYYFCFYEHIRSLYHITEDASVCLFIYLLALTKPLKK